MENVLGKFSIFDFFNLIFTGIIWMISLQFIGIHLFDYISFMFYNSEFMSLLFKNFKIENDGESTFIIIMYLTFMLAVFYICGSCIQELGSFVQDKIFKVQHDAISSVLNDDSILGNKLRKEACIKRAEELFFKRHILFEKDKNFTPEQCHYFYTYCIYYIQIRGLHQKPEKMRTLQGISNMLSTSFGVAAFCGIIAFIFQPELANISYVHVLDIRYFIFILTIYISLSTIFWFRMKKHILYRIRMVLNTYDANIDKES